jgi:hypothetical protein
MRLALFTPFDRAVAAIGLVLALVIAPGCARNKPLALVAQTGQSLSGAIIQAQQATRQLTDGNVLTPEQARPVQAALGRAADKMVPLPDLLIAIDAATKQGQTDAGRINAALAILAAVGIELDGSIKGLPVGQTASNVLSAVTEARRLQQQITDLLARRQTSDALDLLRRGPLAPAYAN